MRVGTILTICGGALTFGGCIATAVQQANDMQNAITNLANNGVLQQAIDIALKNNSTSNITIK